MPPTRTPSGLTRVVSMARNAERLSNAENLAALRPDLAVDDPDFTVPKRAKLLALVRPVGPRFRLSKVGVVVRRHQMGLDS